ncbi:MAG: nitrilase-related carbon-nitrogen hydrolase [Eubacteriales bacterium]|nr:nitrilase-related carbon-nitrogen hydrolase [Eubacteriales bacterium]
MKAVLLQLRVNSSETSAQRWERTEQLLAQLENNPPELVVLPELWAVGFSNFDRYSDEAEPLQGTTLLRLAAWARRLHCHILTGSFVEKTQDGMYNTMALLDTDGCLLGTYRKMHLFGFASREQELLQPGQQTSVIETAYGSFGLATCYDLRFPEQFRAMVARGSMAFLISAAWPKTRLEDWRLFCRVRALENQSFLLACNHAGDINGCIGAGHSMIISPDGTILAEAGETEEILQLDIGLRQAEQFRRQFPALHDRIPIE